MPIANHIYYKGNLVSIALKPPSEWGQIMTYATKIGATPPSDPTTFDQLIKDLKSAGIWQKLDVFYVFAGDSSNGFKLINWIDPNNHYADAYGGLTWDLDGVKGNGSNAYVNTNFISNVDGVNRQLGSAHTFGVIHQVGGIVWGMADQWNAEFFNTAHVYKRLDGNFNNQASINQIGSHFIIRDSSSTGIYIHQDSQYSLNGSNTLATLPNTILRSFNSYGSTKISCWSTGGALTYSETQSFRTIYNNFLTELELTPIA